MSLPNLVRGEFGSEFRVGEATVRKIDSISPEIDRVCLRIASEGFKRPESQLEETVRQHVRDGDLYLAYQDDLPVAFRILQKKAHNTTYLAGAVKKPGSQRHLIRDMTDRLLSGDGTRFIVTRTGSDLVLDEMLRLSDTVIPFNGVMDDNFRFLRNVGLGEIFTAETDPETLVIPDCYGGDPMFNPEYGRPESRNESVSSFMREVMPDESYFRGDAIIFIGLRNPGGGERNEQV